MLLPLPALVYRFWPPVRVNYSALKVPFYDVLAKQRRSGKFRQQLALILITLMWLLLLLASARPQWVGDPVVTPLSGRDLMLAVDLSDSMKERDMVINSRRVDRLQAVQAIAGKFIERREGDRIGLILFGSEAFLLSPLTLDRRSVRALLDEAVIGIAGRQTAIGNAIALAVKRLPERERGDKVLILLTDGKNTTGNISPAQAISLARSKNLKVYTLGIGSERLTRPNGMLFGAAVDEQMLHQIADATNGRFYRARNSQELEQIYKQIDELETADEEAESLRPVTELFYWPAGIALSLLLLLFALRQTEKI